MLVLQRFQEYQAAEFDDAPHPRDDSAGVLSGGAAAQAQQRIVSGLLHHAAPQGPAAWVGRVPRLGAEPTIPSLKAQEPVGEGNAHLVVAAVAGQQHALEHRQRLSPIQLQRPRQERAQPK